MNKSWERFRVYGHPDVLGQVTFVLREDILGVVEMTNTNDYYVDNDIADAVGDKLNKLKSNREIRVLRSSVDWEDWHLKWESHFTPVCFGKRLCIVRENEMHIPNAEIVVKLRLGMAFGTGHHESTWLMLKSMLDMFQPGMRVLDLGAGSGVLSIVAQKMGAESVKAIEFDRDCENNFHENLELNGIKDECELTIASIFEMAGFSADLILLNINTHILAEFLPHLEGNPATIILSGLLTKDIPQLEKIANGIALKIIGTHRKGEWSSLILKKEDE